jgi:chromosome partitioning protein
MEIISILNHKGGVGKTTSAINIGALYAINGKRTLLIDMDPQANLTKGLGIFLKNGEPTIYHSFRTEKPIPLPIRETTTKNLYAVPSSIDFSGIELEISGAMSRETILKRLLKDVEKQYDFCFIDCPPSLGLITINSLVASEKVLIPMDAEFFALTGIDSIVGIIKKIKEFFNPDLKIWGVFFTRYNQQRVLSKQITDEVKKHFGDRLMKSVIRLNVAIPESQTRGQDIFFFDQHSNAAKDYVDLVLELNS